jgi:hypothetical protein
MVVIYWDKFVNYNLKSCNCHVKHLNFKKSQH